MLETIMYTRGKYIPFDLYPLKDFYWTNDYVQRLFHVRDWTWSEAVGNTYHFTNRNDGREAGIRVWRSTVHFDQHSLPPEPHLVLPPGSTSFTDPDAPRGSRFFYLLEVFKGPLDREFTGPFEATALGINVGPGPRELIAGNPGAGFYGIIPAADLITGDLLAAEIGLTSGFNTSLDEPWLKFALDGKTLMVAKKAYRRSVSWNHINACGAVYGDTTIEIQGDTYKVRLLKGAADDVTIDDTNTHDPERSWGSEWNRLFYPMVPNPTQKPASGISGEGIRYGEWASFIEEALGVGSSGGYGRHSWCQEVDDGRSVARGTDGLSHFVLTASSATHTTHGWRPVLELVT